MLSDDAKGGLLEWLFGNGALKKAANIDPGFNQGPLGNKPQLPDPGFDGAAYMKEQVRRQEEQRKNIEKQIQTLPAKPDNRSLKDIIKPLPVKRPEKPILKDALDKLIKPQND